MFATRLKRLHTSHMAHSSHRYRWSNTSSKQSSFKSHKSVASVDVDEESILIVLFRSNDDWTNNVLCFVVSVLVPEPSMEIDGKSNQSHFSWSSVFRYNSEKNILKHFGVIFAQHWRLVVLNDKSQLSSRRNVPTEICLQICTRALYHISIRDEAWGREKCMQVKVLYKEVIKISFARRKFRELKPNLHS